MKGNDKKHKRRLRNTVLSLVFLAVILSVATYAWFIGMRTVYVSPFDVKISSTDSLLLSLDGQKWDTVVTINETNFDVTTYSNNTNWWTGGKGLIPMSSVGTIDDTVSRLELYEKGSLTATPGGYRLMTSRVANNVVNEKEVDGYVAFDLFIKNFSGRQYVSTLDILNEEAIYLALDSEVTVAETGVKNTGIENSVRVAFAQIGRVVGTETVQNTITGITCADTVDGTTPVVTGICNDRAAQIWEPNDKDHVPAAINWYTKACGERTGSIIDTKHTNYGNPSLPYGAKGTCNAISNGTTYPTYAAGMEIDADNQVDIYDGEEFNKYTANTYNETAGTGYLTKMDAENGYFTDTMKEKPGVERPEFMRLAPNSITKVRVYIWIEGQDIDNYDFASIGKAISVAFGFTKERFVEDDVDYTGPTIRPTIALKDDNPLSVSVSGMATQSFDWSEIVDSIYDTVDGDIDPTDPDLDNKGIRVEIYNPIPATPVPGTYTVVYSCTNSNGVTGTAKKTVIVTP